MSILVLGLPRDALWAATLMPEGYALQVWQSDDGLPENAVTSAIQTRDGYIWIGTYGGLVRFDGERFQVFNTNLTPGLQDNRIVSLFEDAQGVVWIGHETGVITRYFDSRFERVEAGSRASDKVCSIGSDQDGRVWALRYSGALDALDNSPGVASLVPPNSSQYISASRDAQGRIWVLENGIAARLTGGKLAPVEFPPAKVSGYVEALAAAADGGLWVARDGRLRKYLGSRMVEDRGAYPSGSRYMTCLLELRDGALALGTLENGLYLISRDGRSVHFDNNNGLPQNWVRFLYEDRESNLWFGSGSGGLASIHRTAFGALLPPEHSQGRAVLSVAPGQNGSLWVGTEGAGLYHFENGAWTHYGEQEGLPNPFIWAVAEDNQGRVWAGNWFGGPYLLQNGRFARHEKMNTADGPITALYVNPENDELLIGSRDGLIQYQGNRSWWIHKNPDASPANVCAVLRDRSGALWFSLYNAGLVRIADGKFSMFTRKDGLPSDAVQCLFADEDGALWAGTADGGLTRFKNGRFATVDHKQGLADNVICHIADDGLGFLWITTHRGIHRVAKEELNRCADGQIPAITGHVYNKYDGVPTGEYSGGLQAAGCRTDDGRLWFTSSKGLFSVDPARIQLNPTIPPVALDSVLVDGKVTPLRQEALSAPIAPEHERLEFRFTALSFVSPGKVQFKYRLEGADKNWSDAGNRRTAYYSRLPAGSYRFRVIACNNDGVWNTEGTSLAFTVAPFFWQTWWFMGLCAIAAFSGVGWAVRFITRRRMLERVRELEQQHAIERERSRIARDIHDDLGGNLTRISMLSQPRRDKAREADQPDSVLTTIFMAAREGILALDEIVWAVDPRHDTLDSLITYMSRYAQEYLNAANVRCRLDMPVEVPALPLRAELRHNLFLAYKEALNNTLKHAAATEVSISLKVEPRVFILEIVDNGRGFDRNQLQAIKSGRISAGNGLRNLERRLAAVGGRCEIATAEAEGTRVTFAVDISEQITPPTS